MMILKRTGCDDMRKEVATNDHPHYEYYRAFYYPSEQVVGITQKAGAFAPAFYDINLLSVLY
jgi:hypothetical protein